MGYQKGTYVVHPKREGWGVGIVTSDERAGVVPVFFENECNIKEMSLSYVDLEQVDAPPESKLFLENILVDDNVKGVKDRQPFPIKVNKFLETFSGGLYGRVIEHHEREYKVTAHDKWVALLNEEDFSRLISEGSWDDLTTRIKTCHHINLMSQFEAIKFADALKLPEGKRKIATALFELLYGKESIQVRFKQYVDTLAAYECDKWPTVTLPLYLRYPEQYMFVKPTVTQEAAANRGFDIKYDSKVNWFTYEHVLMFSNDLMSRLKAYGNPALLPRDMIDIQNFMWCTFTNGWSEEGVLNAEAKLQDT